MTSHDPDWTALDGTPVAPRTGPFATSPFLQALWEHRRVWDGGGSVDLQLLTGDGAAALQLRPGRLEFLGHEDLVDYRSPIGAGGDLVAKAVSELAAGTRFRFDSLPEEAGAAVGNGLDAAGVAHDRRAHTVAAVLDLPETFSDYLAAIGKKERHETRRKRRRFEAALGEPRLVTYRGSGPALNRFFRMHRMAPGEKGEFMTPAMTAFFRSLMVDDRWRLDALYGAGPRMVAAALGWSDASGYYLYNSAFDPLHSGASPGVVLVSMLIERAIDEGLLVFDFLKGDETYKFRLGAGARQLYVIDGVA